MPGASLLTLFDDIAAILDDVSVMTKVAAKKTAGVLGDDLALNAEQVSGVSADRELPVVWAVAKGSAVNKLILVPAALAISAFVPWLVKPLLMVGGLFLCFEGVEKLLHAALHKAGAPQDGAAPAAPVPEADKIKGAIRTDFVLSAEIVTIALGTFANEPMLKQIAALSLLSFFMTVGVYGLVAMIVKLDDAGLHLVRSSGGVGPRALVGRGILSFAPRLMRLLSVAGTIAMFLVGGGIVVHGLPPVHHAVASLTQGMAGGLATVTSSLVDGLIGVVAGLLVVGLVTGAKRVMGRR